MSSDAVLGWHWMAVARRCADESVASVQAVEDVLVAMVTGLGLRAVAPPVVRQTEAGVAGVVLLAESHLAIHTTRDRAEAMVDLFSCAPFDHHRAAELLESGLRAAEVQSQVIVRGTC